MIRQEKMRPAIGALQAILVTVRNMAHQKVAYKEIAHILDVAEYLPALMLEAADRTDDFRESLVDLSMRNEAFTWAIERFDADQ